ncbi:MAG: hypothetical protein ACRCXT_18975 [Paraclostridium sp.]
MSTINTVKITDLTTLPVSLTGNEFIEISINNNSYKVNLAEVAALSGGGSGGLTLDVITHHIVNTVLGYTVTDNLVSSSKNFFAPKILANPGTVEIGNMDVSGANNTLGVVNTTTGSRSLMIGAAYFTDGTVRLRSYDLSPLQVNSRQLDSSEIQPNSPYTFSFVVPDNLIRTSIFMIPAEAGTITIESRDINNKLVTDIQPYTFTQDQVGTEVEIQMSNHVVYYKNDVGNFTLSGARVKGKTINGQFIPYFKVREYTILSFPNIVTENNIETYHAESVKMFSPSNTINLPTNVSNVVVKYGRNVTRVITQPLPDLTVVKDGTRVVIDNLGKNAVTLTTTGSTQTIQGNLTYPVYKNDGVMLIGDTIRKMWIPINFYTPKDISSVTTFDGGAAVQTLPRILGMDGGTASSTFTRTFDSGNA